MICMNDLYDLDRRLSEACKRPPKSADYLDSTTVKYPADTTLRKNHNSSVSFRSRRSFFSKHVQRGASVPLATGQCYRCYLRAALISDGVYCTSGF